MPSTRGNRTTQADGSLFERPDSVPKPGQIPPFDAGWNAHEIGMARETVCVFAADPGWALLGYDTRAKLAEQET